MKSSRGFSFIEVIIALAVMSILLPVVGIVFYNLFVTPPEQSARLKLNNEVALLSSMLYQDAHLSENFSAGNGNPYYGNFTWTDYNVTPAQQYLVSYYATCPNVSDPNCVNQIVRQVGNGSASMLPSSTPTPTPASGKTIPGTIEAESYDAMYGIATENTSDTGGGLNVGWTDSNDWMDYNVNVVTSGTYTIEFRVAGTANGSLQLKEGSNVLCSIDTPNTGGWQTWQTVTATAYLSSGAKTLRVNVVAPGWNLNWITFSLQTYQFCSGYQVDKWAWEKVWTAAEWSSRPSSPDDFFSTSAHDAVEADFSSYNKVCSDDNDAWGNPNTSPQDYAVYSQQYQIKVNQNRSVVTALSVTWKGYGGNSTSNTKLRIWNYSGSGSWNTLVNVSGPASKIPTTYPVTISSAPSDYIDASTGIVSLLASSEAVPLNYSDLTVYTDYMALTVLTPGSSANVSPPAPVPTVIPFNSSTTWTPPAGVPSFDVLVVGGGGGGGGASGWRVYTTGGGGGAGGVVYQTNYIPVYVETFTSSGTFSVPGDVTSVQVLVVGGGGGGGSTDYQYGAGGGGGGGGLIYNPSFSVTPNASISVTVGGSGAGAPDTSNANGSPGDQSVFGSLTASGGAGGGGAALNGPSGGSGGGGGARTATQGLGGSGTAGQGLAGGNSYRDGTASRNAGGGGGGNGSAGSNAASSQGGNGGAGTDYSGIFGAVGGASGWFSGGGGGGAPGTPGSGVSGGGASGGNGGYYGANGANAVANTGGGGGGAGGGTSLLSWEYDASGGNGGSGVVIVKYTSTAKPITVTVGGGGSGGDGYALGSTGSNSAFHTVTAYGGGGGGSGGDSVSSTGLNGGSGGGGGGRTVTGTVYSGGTATPSGQGTNGGNGWSKACCSGYDRAASGGGGGAGGTAGTTAGDNDPGEGGAGVSYSSTFGNVGGLSNGQFAGGGGGANYGTQGTATYGGGYGSKDGVYDGSNGTANTGGGGGGAYAGALIDGQGGNGGSGFVAVKYAIPYRILNTSVGASGGGTVIPAPPGWYYPAGTTQTIVATAATCYSFVNWSGDTGTIANPSLATTTIIMNGNYTIQANFVHSSTTYALSLTPSPAAGGSPSYEGTGPFACGFSVPISANPDTAYNFSYWSPSDGVASPNESDTTVLMTQTRELTAYYSNTSPAPAPTPTNYNTTMYLTWHITADNFSLSQNAKGLINASMTAGVKTGMGKYVQKQLTIYMMPRPSYLAPEENMWGIDTIGTLSGFLISGDRSSISGDVKVNGTVTVEAAAELNRIDGTLTCPTIVGDDQTKLAYTLHITQSPKNALPSGKPAQSYFTTNLSLGIETYDDVNQEYVFFRDINLHTDPTARTRVWQGGDPDSNHTLKPGTYYSNGTITLEDTETRGTVTFIAGNRIIISNNAAGASEYKIGLTNYDDDGLLFWANGSVGSTSTPTDGAILITGAYQWHACVSLEGVLFAPNGEIELAGSGGSRWGFPVTADLYNTALISKYLTISGSYWNIYRW